MEQQADAAAQPHPTSHPNGSNIHQTPASSSTTTQSAAARTTKGKYSLTDFTLKRTLGTGSFGRVHLVQSNHNQRFYAVKVLKKAQVVKMKQVEHTNDERKMLQKVKHAFLVTLWGTFQDSKNLYMVMDFVEGGELFSLLRKSQVSLPGHFVPHPMIRFGSEYHAHYSKRDFQIQWPNSMLPKLLLPWIICIDKVSYIEISSRKIYY